MNVFALHLVTGASAPTWDQGPVAVRTQKSNDYQEKGSWKAPSLTAQVFWQSVTQCSVFHNHNDSQPQDGEWVQYSECYCSRAHQNKQGHFHRLKENDKLLDYCVVGKKCTEKNKRDA